MTEVRSTGSRGLAAWPGAAWGALVPVDPTRGRWLSSPPQKASRFCCPTMGVLSGDIAEYPVIYRDMSDQKPLLIRLSVKDRADLEVHRARLGLRSAAEVIRFWIASGVAPSAESAVEVISRRPLIRDGNDAERGVDMAPFRVPVLGEFKRVPMQKGGGKK